MLIFVVLIVHVFNGLKSRVVLSVQRIVGLLETLPHGFTGDPTSLARDNMDIWQ